MNWKYRNNDVGGILCSQRTLFTMWDCVSTESVSQDLSHKIHRYRDAIHTQMLSMMAYSSYFYLSHSVPFLRCCCCCCVFIIFVIFGTKTCVTINFKLFWCFTNISFLAASRCHILAEYFIYSFNIVATVILTHDALVISEFRLALVIIVRNNLVNKTYIRNNNKYLLNSASKSPT